MQRVVGGCVALVAVGAMVGCEPAPSPWRSELVTVNSAGTDSGNGASSSPVFSPDGTKIAFTTTASNLGPSDTGVCLTGTGPPYQEVPCNDVYVRDLVTGEVALVSVNSTGTNGGNGHSGGPTFSPDGTKIAFSSGANNLGPVDNDPTDPSQAFITSDVYLRDLVAGSTIMVSTNAAGTDSSDGPAGDPVFSPDGRGILFGSFASNHGADAHGGRDVFLRDLATGIISLVSASGSGTSFGSGEAIPANQPFSPDGTKIAFVSTSNHLSAIDGDRPGSGDEADVYVRDLVTGTTSLVSVNASGTSSANGRSENPRFGGTGSEIVFTSLANDFGPTDGPRGTGSINEDVYLRDLETGAIEIVSANAAGTDSGDHISREPVISPDGTKVAFSSRAGNLGATDTNGRFDVYVRDRAAGETHLASVNAGGTNGGDGVSSRPEFSITGGALGFFSSASDLGPVNTSMCVGPPTVNCQDFFLQDLASGTTTLVSANADGSDSGDQPTSTVRFSSNGRQIALVSASTNFGPTDTNGLADIYLASLHEADMSVGLQVEPEPVVSGATTTYNLTFRNDGPEDAESAVGVLVLPESLELGTVVAEGCLPPTDDQPNVVTCDLGDLSAGEERSAIVTATVIAAQGSTVTATAVVSSSTLDPVGSNNSASRPSVVS